MGVISIAAEEIHAFVVEAVSGNDSAIHIDWEADIGGDYLHREYICRVSWLEPLSALIADGTVFSN